MKLDKAIKDVLKPAKRAKKRTKANEDDVRCSNDLLHHKEADKGFSLIKLQMPTSRNYATGCMKQLRKTRTVMRTASPHRTNLPCSMK